MEPAAAPDLDPAAETLAAMERAALRPPEEVAAAVAAALQTAGAVGGEAAERLDEAVVLALRDAPRLDSVLDRLPLTALAALGDRCIARLDAEPSTFTSRRRACWEFLDLVRRSSVLRRVAAAGAVTEWTDRIRSAVDASQLTAGVLFRRHAEIYGSKTLFEVPAPSGMLPVTWRQFAARVDAFARGLLATVDREASPRVAILSENRLEMAVADLACATAGLVSVMIPANATETDVAFMLGHAHAGVAVVSGGEQLRKVVRVRESLPGLVHVIAMDLPSPAPRGVLAFEEVIARASRTATADLDARLAAIRVEDLATVMYTSGTTGVSKGIQFSHRNIVFKRFARALALPEIGEDDVFLCYLPFFHTFGRFLELYGCIFWGATYCFLDNPSLEALVQGMRRHRPTVFISVPKKWIQIHEAIALEAPPDRASDADVAEAAKRITGGRLRWGLSAAGHLDSEVFRFFQSQRIELMSGFGMTEATGGITMTPPGGYRDDSLGAPLPGIEIRIDDDGELSVRGPYVMMGYLDPPEGERTVEADGWFRTGDLMERDSAGFIRLVDRKKEIYKNVKGETIAPQRVENLFRDFESVGRVFLVGDHREYNTALIYPNPNATHVDLKRMSPDEQKTHFRSIVASVNAFLSPYERIVDFAVVDRDLDPERGELTPKGTPRRKVVETHFADVIRLLYRRTHLRVGGVDIVVPNWLFQVLGLTAQDLHIEPDRLVLPGGRSLQVRRLQENVAQVGSCLYRHPPEPLPLGVLLTTPRLWLGNDALVDFANLDVKLRERPGRAGDGVEWVGRSAPFHADFQAVEAVRALGTREELDLRDLHAAALLLGSNHDDGAFAAVAVLQQVLAHEEGPLVEPARLLLGRTARAPSLELRRKAFQVLAPAERESRFPATLRRFLEGPGVVLDAETRTVLCERNLSDARIDAFQTEALESAHAGEASRGVERRLASLLRFLADYGAAHPTRYRKLRAFLVRLMLFGGRETARQEAVRAVEELQKGFRAWLGPAVRVAVDPETGQEYRWEDVVAFDEEVPAEDRTRILSAIRDTAMLREAVFLFSGGATPRLSDIPPRGLFIRRLGVRPEKSVYRLTVQTRFQGHYEIAINLVHDLPLAKVREEIQYLILCAEGGERGPLVEDFGGWWSELRLWSEEFVTGDSLDRVLRKLSRRTEELDRFRGLWPFFGWSALSAHVDFWNRLGRRVELADPSMTNVIVPTHDYHTGARIVSMSSVRPFRGLGEMLRFFRGEFAEPAERQYPALAGGVRWNVVFSSLLEVVGEHEGVRMLRELAHREDETLGDGMAEALRAYLAAVEAKGFYPMGLYFAIQRYRRWAALTVEPLQAARARMLQELYDTYRLQDLSGAYPEARTRFFRETVFENAPTALGEGLEGIIRLLRVREIVGDALADAISDLRARIELGPDDDYFLTRLSFPYLRPEDAAGFVQADAGGRHQSEIVVTLEDEDGSPFQVRHALNPKEVGRLHRLFLGAKLDVRFRPEHQYLVAQSERGQIIGGIYYEVEEEGRSAHLEKIVVAERYRKKGVADGLMNEFFNRLRAQGVKTVTTGFFRPEYFYAYGFAIEKRYAGLVKSLELAG